jgi:hypothetical protein
LLKQKGFLHSNQDCTRAITHQFLNRPCKGQDKLQNKNGFTFITAQTLALEVNAVAE